MILLLSTNRELTGSFVNDLKQEGYQIKVSGGEKNLRPFLLTIQNLRMVIIDLESMEEIAAAIFRDIKDDPQLKYVPILCIIRRDLVIEQLIAFELGADDFIYVPYSTIELQLKMRAIHGLLDMQSQLQEKEGKIKTLKETQKILVTLSHYINNSLTPLYSLVQFLNEKNPDEIKRLRGSVITTIEFIKKILTSLNNFVQSGEYKIRQDSNYHELLIDIEKELQKLQKIQQS